MTFTRTYITEPGGEGGSCQHWHVTANSRTVALMVAHVSTAVVDNVPDVARPFYTAAPAGGAYVLGGIYLHEPSAVSVCTFHGDCDVTPLGSAHANPIWQQIAAAGLTDAAVYDALEQLHTQVFTAVAR
jgi:hypothetical protein